MEWSNAHGLTLDPFSRFPLAQFNIELYYAALYSVGLGAYVEFITTMFLTITATGIVSLTSRVLKELGADSRLASILGFATATVFVACPVVLHYSNSGYVDIPAGAMLLGFASELYSIRLSRGKSLVPLGIIGGCFVGIKVALVPSLLLFAVIIVAMARRNERARSSALNGLAALALFAAPWFTRNLLASGDPVDPVLNLALRHTDPFWSVADIQGINNDLHMNIPVLLTPIWFYLHPVMGQAGVSLSFCFFYVPFIVAAVALFSPRFRSAFPTLTLLSSIVAFAMIQNLLASNRIARYTLHYYCLFLVVLSATIYVCFSRLPLRNASLLLVGKIVMVGLVFLMALPPLVPIIEYYNVRTEFNLLDLAVHDPEAELSRTPGYTEATDLATALADSKSGKPALTVNFEFLSYFFRLHHTQNVGDWIGPARFSELQTAIQTNQVGAYLDRFQIGAALVAAKNPSLGVVDENRLIIALKQAGFVNITQPESDILEFIRADILAAARKNGYRNKSASPNSIDFEENFEFGQIGLDPHRSFNAGDRSANLLRVLDGPRFANSITIINGDDIEFSHISMTKRSVLSFDVSKTLAVGTPAIAWVKIRSGPRTLLSFSQEMQPATGIYPAWQHVSLKTPFNARDATIAFGASSIPTGGIGDWISFVRPILTEAHFTSRTLNLRTKQVATLNTTTSPELGGQGDTLWQRLISFFHF
jgi:hypothetical protein